MPTGIVILATVPTGIVVLVIVLVGIVILAMVLIDIVVSTTGHTDDCDNACWYWRIGDGS